MRDTRQDDELDLSADVGSCQGCGKRRVLCTFGECSSCHQTSRNSQWRVSRIPPHAHLCCGWWGSLSVLPWRCLTCGTVHTRSRHA